VSEELAIALAKRAAKEGITRKQVITRALAAAGLPVDPLDLEDRTPRAGWAENAASSTFPPSAPPLPPRSPRWPRSRISYGHNQRGKQPMPTHEKGDVQMTTFGPMGPQGVHYSFSITSQYGSPLLTIGYRTEPEAKEARQRLETILAEAIVVTPG
jgi:hypothetical protein